MAATVAVEECNGATAGTWTAITTGRYCTTDAYNPGDTYPCVVPAASLNYSYWKSHRIAWTGIGTQISNIKWYTPAGITVTWGLGTGGMLVVGLRDTGDNGCPTANYQQAVGTPGTSGTFMHDGSAGHAYYKGQTAEPANASGYIVSASLLVDSTVHTTNTHSKHIVTQAIIDTDATQGDKANVTFTFQYDEI